MSADNIKLNKNSLVVSSPLKKPFKIEARDIILRNFSLMNFKNEEGIIPLRDRVDAGFSIY